MSYASIMRELVDPLNIGRVIARPFIGETRQTFTRTGNRRDYSVPPPEPTLLDRLTDAGRMVIAIGKIGDIYAHQGIGQVRKANGNMALFDETLVAMDDAQDGDLVFTNFVDFDMLYGHRRDVPGTRPRWKPLTGVCPRHWPNCVRAILWFSLQITAATRPIRELIIRANGYLFSATVQIFPTPRLAFARPSPILEKQSPPISVSRRACMARVS